MRKTAYPTLKYLVCQFGLFSATPHRNGRSRSEVVVFVSQQVQISYQLNTSPLYVLGRLTFLHSTDIGSRDILLVQVLDHLRDTSVQ
jgi:hypothetical protein